MRKQANPLSILILLAYTAVTLVPVLWLVLTSIKEPADTGALPPRFIPSDQAPADSYEFRVSFASYTRLFEDEETLRYLINSVLIAGVSTVASVLLGAFAAYAFSRFHFAGSKDWQFFILSTRMLPPLAVAVPISWMYGYAGLNDTHFGLILLYTCFNLSFSTWMMKVFLDEIPKAFEEAALMDGYSRGHVLFKIVLPQAKIGLLATSVFCFVSAWNEYAFALTLTSTQAVTVPVHLHSVIGDTSVVPWGPLAAGSVLFLTPVVAFGMLMRRHLVTGVTFGGVKG